MTLTPAYRQWLDNLRRQTMRDVEETLAFRTIATVIQRELERRQQQPKEPDEDRSYQFLRNQERRQQGQQHDPNRNPYRRGPSSAP